jgi:hypothetical protein
MRAYDQCRSHLDNILGPRGAGAPLGNQNARKHCNGVPVATIELIHRIAHDLYQYPDKLQAHIAQLLDYFYNPGDGQEIPGT